VNSLKDLTILISASGCPGASTLIKSLKNVKERRITIIGTDMDPDAIGRFFSDKFYKTPPASDPNYISKIKQICKLEKVDVVLPESSAQILKFSQAKAEFEDEGVQVIVSDPEPILLANNKFLMYEELRKNTNLPLPKYSWPCNLDEFLDDAGKLGYPEKPICFKPHEAKGSRGFRIIDSRVDRKDLLLNKKPNSRYMSLKEFEEIFREAPSFPDFLLMEYVPGFEMTSDCLCLNGEALLTTVKSVEEARWGIIVKGELLNEPEIVEQTEFILKSIPLSYNTNIQFIKPKNNDPLLIEINPRVSTFIYQSNLIQPYLSIKLGLGEETPDSIKRYENKIAYGRRMVRYMDQVFYDKGS
jgi:carbamoyl-phosphate synthase large subunit